MTPRRSHPEAISFFVPGEPVPFARAGANGRKRYTPRKQADFMAVIKLFASRAMAGRQPLNGPLSLNARVVYLVPGSWPKKTRDAAKWKTSKPDLDNTVKLLKDSMNKLVYVDDAQIAELTAQKLYGPIAGLTITVQQLSEAA